MKKPLAGTLKRACKFASSLCLLLALAACSSTPMTHALLESSPSIPSYAELEGTPFFPQEKYQCGPAALATVLHFQDKQTLPNQLISKVYIPEKQGSVPIEMVAAARSYERLVYPLDANLESLVTEVSSGHPVLVMQNLGFNWQPQWHYAVVIGYDLKEQIVVLRSGTEKRLKLPFKTFERTWRRANYWALVVMNPDEIPESAQPTRYLSAAQQLETTGHVQAAIQAYQTAISKWPDNHLPWLALGNAYYSKSQYRLSEQTFLQGLEEYPNNGELWNNLGYALSAQGCYMEAQDAVRCAISQQPDNQGFQHSLSDVSANSKGITGQCQPVYCPTKTGYK